MNILKCVELFGGIGAFRKALIKQNIPHKILSYVEIDKRAVESYNALYGEEFSPQDICSYHLPEDIQIDILMHGSPCQDFSAIGLRKGGEKDSGTRSSLLFETLRVIEEVKMKPKYVIWENVKGVLSKEMRPTFLKYLSMMQDMGYKNSYKILDALDFGVPQKRERIFVISTLEEFFDFESLETQSGYGKLPFFLDENVNDCYVVKQKSMLEKIP